MKMGHREITRKIMCEQISRAKSKEKRINHSLQKKDDLLLEYFNIQERMRVKKGHT